MKFIKSALLIVSLLFPTLALSTPVGGFYAGMDLSKSLSDYRVKDKKCIVVLKQKSNVKRSAPIMNLYGGWKFNSFCELEAGYFTEMSVKRLNSNIVNKLSGAHTSLLFIIPVGDKFEVKPGIGMSWNKYINNPREVKFSKKVIVVAPRLILAIEYKVNDSIQARASIASHRIKMGNSHDNFTTSNLYKLGLGMNYSF